MHREELSKEAQLDLVDKAIVGDGQALEELLRSTSGLVFNLALRFLGTVHDAEDASQEIAVKIMTRLSTFRKESAFSTWVYRIAVNHLKDCRTHQFANAPFSFEMYGADIVDERAKDVPDLSEGVDRGMLARELKLSCTNVMLQCLDADSRCAYVLGTMFKVDSSTAADVLGITPEAYRQRLSRRIGWPRTTWSTSSSPRRSARRTPSSTPWTRWTATPACSTGFPPTAPRRAPRSCWKRAWAPPASTPW